MTYFNPHSETLFRGVKFKDGNRDMTKEEFGDATRFQSVEVDDHVMFAKRNWRVTGVFLGCVGQESVATIVAMDRKPSYIGGQGSVAECIVPLEFLYGRIYRYVKPGDPLSQPTNDRNLPRDPEAEAAAERETASQPERESA